MQLTLVPPDAYPIPSAFHAHEIKPPSYRPRKSVKPPELWTRTRQQLAEVGIRAPDPLAGDLAAWWQFAVSAVEWNLELEEVIVTLADGTRERWDLQPSDRLRSTSTVEDSEMEDASGPSEPMMMSSSSPLKEPDSVADRPLTSRWHPDTVSARLRSFALQLRNAYEDLGTATVSDPAAPDISTETDYRLLMLLAAEPSRQVPFEWSDAQTMYEYAMMGVDGEMEEASEAETANESRLPAWRRELRRPSQGRRLDVDDPNDFDPAKFTGQFRTKRRPMGRKDRNGHPIRAYTYLAVVDILGQIRSYLCDLFSATVIPILRDRIPPSYTLWAADSAIVWVRREAIKRARDAADLIVELLDDDGERFDCSEASSSHMSSPMRIDADDKAHLFDIIVDMDEDEGMLDGSHGIDEWQAEERRQERLADNPLRLLRDDFELRKWCIDISDRARMLDLIDDDTTAIRSPDWIKPVPPYEVSSLDAAQSSDSDMLQLGRSVRRRSMFTSRSRNVVETPSSSPPPGMDRPRSASPTVPGLTHSDTETEPSSELDELSDEDIRVSSTLLARDFFYPDDPLGEGFLPRRLPLELVDTKTKGGAELQEHRELLHSVLNEVAGLQKRLVALHELVKEETKTWEEERAESVATPHKKSTLERAQTGRKVSHPPPGPVRRRHPSRPGAPLLKQSCDRALSHALDDAYRKSDPPNMPKHVRQGELTPAAQDLPRKRQRHNLETYGRLLAMSNHILNDEPEVPIPDFMQKRKRSVDGPGFRKKRKNGPPTGGSVRPAKRLKRHRQQDDNVTPAIEASQTVAASPSAQPMRDERHLAAVGLSARRRKVLEALSNDSGLGDEPLDIAFGDEADDDDVGDDELGTDSLGAASSVYGAPFDWGDEIDELEEVVIEPITQQEELPVEVDDTADSPYERMSASSLGSGGPSDVSDVEAPTRFGSPIPYSRPGNSPLTLDAAMPSSRSGSPVRPIPAARPDFPLSAARLENDVERAEATSTSLTEPPAPVEQLSSQRESIHGAARPASHDVARSPRHDTASTVRRSQSLLTSVLSSVAAQLEAQRNDADGRLSGSSGKRA